MLPRINFKFTQSSHSRNSPPLTRDDNLSDNSRWCYRRCLDKSNLDDDFFFLCLFGRPIITQNCLASKNVDIKISHRRWLPNRRRKREKIRSSHEFSDSQINIALAMERRNLRRSRCQFDSICENCNSSLENGERRNIGLQHWGFSSNEERRAERQSPNGFCAVSL